MKTSASKTNSSEFVVPAISRSATNQPDDTPRSIDQKLFERIVQRLPELPTVTSTDSAKRSTVKSA